MLYADTFIIIIIAISSLVDNRKRYTSLFVINVERQYRYGTIEILMTYRENQKKHGMCAHAYPLSNQQP